MVYSLQIVTGNQYTWDYVNESTYNEGEGGRFPCQVVCALLCLKMSPEQVLPFPWKPGIYS